MTGIYELFDRDTEIERQGIEVDYGNARFLIARAGGTNVKFRKVFEAKSKPYRRQIQANMLADEVATRILAETYAEAVILRVDAKPREGDEDYYDDVTEDGWVPGHIPTRSGELVEDNEKNRVKLLIELEELFLDLQNMASTAANFRREEDDEDEGN